MRQSVACLLALLVGLTALPCAEDNLIQPAKISGRIVSLAGPVVGSTVSLMIGDSLVAAQPTDDNGRFEIDGRVDHERPHALVVTSIGFETTRISLSLGPDITLPDIILSEEPLELSAVNVTASRMNQTTSTTFDRTEIVRRAGQSFVPTNPIAAIKRPEIVRQGSVHSSQLRVDGSAPDFQIGGASIGTDPDHYGMFAVLPTPAVDGIELQARGTGARQSAPSVVELTPPKAYNRPFSGEINLSMIEATGAIAYGNEDRYALATVRKSVLDQLVNNIDIRAGRRTIPPAGFTDLFLTAGRKSGNHEIVISQYHAGDRLIYNTGPTKVSPNGVSTFQDTEEHFVSARYNGLVGGLLFGFTGDVHLRAEDYQATSEHQPAALDIDLKEQTSRIGTRLDIAYDWRDRTIEVGVESRAVLGQQTSLSQTNWNFLPPDATSDNPHPYQAELNAYYGNVENSRTDLDNAVYLSLSQQAGKFSFTNGLRLQTFSGMSHSAELVQRHRITYRFSADTRLGLFLGSFAESPVSRILEPYQVLVRLDLGQLKPVETRLLSLRGLYKSLSIECFARRSSNLPVLEPRFGGFYRSGQISSPPALAMFPTGKSLTYGLELSLDAIRLPDPRFGLSASYAITHTNFTTPFAKYPADLDAPHRFFARLEFQASRSLSLGTEFAARSGYPFTPYGDSQPKEDRYNSSFYTEQASAFNSSRFPINYQLNVSATYDFGRSQLFLTVANLSNRGNPVINTNNGYIYDAGILPSIGYRITF